MHGSPSDLLVVIVVIYTDHTNKNSGVANRDFCFKLSKSVLRVDVRSLLALLFISSY